jgi:hypothetical protein
MVTSDVWPIGHISHSINMLRGIYPMDWCDDANAAVGVMRDEEAVNDGDVWSGLAGMVGEVAGM